MPKKLKHALVARIAGALQRAFSALPRDPALTLGGLVGLALWKIQRRDAFRAERNIELAYPGRFGEQRRKAVARAAFINTGFHICDAIRSIDRYDSELRELITVEGLENFERLYRRGKGVLAVTGHIGALEILAAFFGRSGYRTAVIGREAYESRLNQLLLEIRTANRVLTINTNQPKKFISCLRRGYAIGVLIDNDSSRVRGEFLESCGRLARTPVGQTLAGLRTGAAFMPLVCLRREGRYVLRFFPEEKPREVATGEYEEKFAERLKIADLTWRIRRILDREIAQAPEQWPWVHNRWHSRPGKEDFPLPGLELFRRSGCPDGGNHR